MLFVFVGNNAEDRKKRIDSLKKQYSTDVDYLLDENNFSNDSISPFLENGFFEEKTYLVILQSLLESPHLNLIKEYICFLEKSKNIFIITEDFLEKSTEDSLNSSGVIPIILKEEVSKKEFNNPFIFTEYVLARDKKNAWITLNDLKNKSEIGQILATLFWSLKTLYIVSDSSISQTQSGLKPFVYSKHKKYTSLWSIEDQNIFLSRILSLQSDNIFDDNGQYCALEELVLSL